MPASTPKAVIFRGFPAGFIKPHWPLTDFLPMLALFGLGISVGFQQQNHLSLLRACQQQLISN